MHQKGKNTIHSQQQQPQPPTGPPNYPNQQQQRTNTAYIPTFDDATPSKYITSSSRTTFLSERVDQCPSLQIYHICHWWL